MLGVSRGPVREAFNTLEQEGLITIVPRRGARVSQFNVDEAMEVYEAREHLEGLSIRLATPHFGPDTLRVMDGILTEMARPVEQGDAGAYLVLSLKFHELIWTRNPNRVVANFVRMLWRQALLLRSISIRLPGRLEASYRAHMEMLACIAAGDGHGAEQSARRWISEAKQELRARFPTNLPSSAGLSVENLSPPGRS